MGRCRPVPEGAAISPSGISLSKVKLTQSSSDTTCFDSGQRRVYISRSRYDRYDPSLASSSYTMLPLRSTSVDWASRLPTRPLPKLAYKAFGEKPATERYPMPANSRQDRPGQLDVDGMRLFHDRQHHPTTVSAVALHVPQVAIVEDRQYFANPVDFWKAASCWWVNQGKTLGSPQV